jgi:hypothetical protein
VPDARGVALQVRAPILRRANLSDLLLTTDLTGSRGVKLRRSLRV